jgi:hypothetical protein
MPGASYSLILSRGDLSVFQIAIVVTQVRLRILVQHFYDRVATRAFFVLDCFQALGDKTLYVRHVAFRFGGKIRSRLGDP